MTSVAPIQSARRGYALLTGNPEIEQHGGYLPACRQSDGQLARNAFVVTDRPGPCWQYSVLKSRLPFRDSVAKQSEASFVDYV